MITIITGKINQYKTTQMIHLFEMNQKGDGFVSLKNMKDNQVNDYQAMKLSTQEKRTLLIHEQSNLDVCTPNIKVGPYMMCLSTLHWIENEISEMIKDLINPIYLDEIGLLELNNQGFHALLIELIKSNLDLILVVRSNLLDQVISKYHLINPIIINALSGGNHVR